MGEDGEEGVEDQGCVVEFEEVLFWAVDLRGEVTWGCRVGGAKGGEGVDVGGCGCEGGVEDQFSGGGGFGDGVEVGGKEFGRGAGVEGEAIEEHFGAEILEGGFGGPFAVGGGVDNFQFAATHEDEGVLVVWVRGGAESGGEFGKGPQHVQLDFEVVG